MKRQYIALSLTVLLLFHLPLVFSEVPMSDGQTDAPESVTSATDPQVQEIKAQLMEAINEHKRSKSDLDEILNQVRKMRDEKVLNSKDISDIIAEITRKKNENGPQANVQSQPLGTENTNKDASQKKSSSDSSSSRAVKGRPTENTRSEIPRPDSVVPIVTTPLVNNDQIPAVTSTDPSVGKQDDDHVVMESIDRKKKKDPIEREPKGQSNTVPSKNKSQVKSDDNPRPKPINGQQKANGNTGAKQNTGPKNANGSPGPKPNTSNQNANKATGPKANSDKKNPTKDKEQILPVKVVKNVGKFVGGLVG
ncbi:hypothetical protein ACJMK2_027220 [Sinanodonta woodiana]|uniref:Uncharacterized protein n=1 Tax=Sinanodonta woodiana TaxID=1069815 RepID=A0ABD3XMH0_SINWO